MAATSPVLPAEFEDLVVDPTDSLATAIIKTYVRLPVLLYRWMRWFFNPDGTISADGKLWLCEGCQQLAVEETMEEET